MYNMDVLSGYLSSYQFLFAWIAFVGFVLLVLVISITPLIIGAIPDDYFKQEKRPARQNPAFVILVWIFIKNVLGAVLVISGIVMLVLPGQGILTIFIGLLLMNYPGKYRLERKILSYPKVLKMVNWIRQKQNKNTFNI